MEPSGIEPQRLRENAQQLADAAGLYGPVVSDATRPGAALELGAAIVAALGLSEVRKALTQGMRDALRALGDE